MSKFNGESTSGLGLGEGAIRERNELRAELADARATLAAVAEQREYYAGLVSEARDTLRDLADALEAAAKRDLTTNSWGEEEMRISPREAEALDKARAWLAKPDAWAREDKPE